MSCRFELESAVAATTLEFGAGKVPRPPHWSGFRVTPESIEFWSERPFRGHARRLFTRLPEGWTSQRLFP